MTLNLAAYPQCASRLHFQRVNLADELMKPIWAAVCVAEDFKDKDLTKFGGFNFDDYSDENGYRQLGRLEQFMAARREEQNTAAFHRKQEAEQKDIRERAKAFLGSIGIKVSKLASDDEYWAVAAILWPGHVNKPDRPTFADFVKQISSMNKKARPRLARENLKHVPSHLVSDKASQVDSPNRVKAVEAAQ